MTGKGPLRSLQIPRFVGALLVILLLPLSSSDAAEWTGWNAETTSQVRRNDTPVLLLITAGYCRPCRNLANARLDTDLFAPVLLDRDVRPELATAYLAFAEAFLGEPVELPVVVALTPFLDPVAAKGSVTPQSMQTFVSELEAEWSREKLLGTALLVRRLTLQGWMPAVPSTPGQRLRTIYTSLLHGRFGEAESEELRRMSRTALYDQLGGGFHRAARDDAWTTPEFEKLLADQAMAVLVYTAAWQLTGEQRFATVATTTADLILRQFLDSERGLFFESLGSHSLVPAGGQISADGAYYVWDESEIRELLGDEHTEALMVYFGVSERTISKELDRTGDLAGKVIFNLPEGTTPPSEELLTAADRLLEVRSTRPSPERDDTVHTSSTGLAISALARAGIVFAESRYSAAAEQALEALLSRNLAGDQLNAISSPRRSVPASPLDYAFLIRGLIDVYEGSFNPVHLSRAFALQQVATGVGGDELAPEMIREITPAPDLTWIIGRNLVQLGTASNEASWIERGIALEGVEADRHQILVLAADRSSILAPLVEVARDRFRPNLMIVMLETTAERDALSPHVSALERVPECNSGKLGERVEWNGKIDCTPIALLCRGAECKAVPHDPAALRGSLD